MVTDALECGTPGFICVSIADLPKLKNATWPPNPNEQIQPKISETAMRIVASAQEVLFGHSSSNCCFAYRSLG